jgi:hypothetical protein
MFYQKWVKIVQEDEFIALDITSISSDSENLEEVAFGHNKENNKKKQFNLCMLFGEKSYMPMYQIIYHGSLTDTVTLQNTIMEFSAIIGNFNFKLVMDRGFYSKENIDFMLSKKDLKFILGVPFTTIYAKKLADLAEKSICNMNNYIKTSNNGDNIKGSHYFVSFDGKSIEIVDEKCGNGLRDRTPRRLLSSGLSKSRSRTGQGQARNGAGPNADRRHSRREPTSPTRALFQKSLAVFCRATTASEPDSSLG